MCVRKMIEAREAQTLSTHACLSQHTRGRQQPFKPCPIRTSFQHDRDRILHSKAFRRLKHKTQVFLSPEGDHYRTRLTHTLEVAQIARTVARALGFNEDLTEAIALGHDLGHTPFGHAGERVLNELLSTGFHHARQSLRVIDRLEKEGEGLNLTYEVREGILHHSKGKGPLIRKAEDGLELTGEAQIVRVADVMAYVNHDLDDAVRAGVVSFADIPSSLMEALGQRHAERINHMVTDLIETSRSNKDGKISFSDEIETTITALRTWLYQQVYQANAVQEDFCRASRILRELFHFFVQHPSELKRFDGLCLAEDPFEVSVADFIAGMTDRFALMLYEELFMPKPWKAI